MSRSDAEHSEAISSNRERTGSTCECSITVDLELACAIRSDPEHTDVIRSNRERPGAVSSDQEQVDAIMAAIIRFVCISHVYSLASWPRHHLPNVNPGSALSESDKAEFVVYGCFVVA